MIAFMNNHPIATVFIVWIIAYWTYCVIARTLRARMVSRSGWPPPHLDADGDWARSDGDDI